jgi:phosphatidylinositol alpha-1,6-mannosyltransferase
MAARSGEHKVRSLLLADSFLPHRGGSRTYYYQLYKDWAPDQVTVLTKKVPGWQEFDARESTDHFRIIRRFRPVPSSRYSELPKAVLPLLHAAARTHVEHVDVLHSGDLFPQGITALLLRRLRALPYIAFCHGEEVSQTDRFRYQPTIRNRIYLSADAVIANADYACRRLREIGVPADRIHKITPGVDCDVFSPGTPNPELQERHRLSKCFVLLTVARLIPRKGHDMVLKAVARLAGEFPYLHYLIVGTGPEELKLRDLASALGISQRVTFAGFVSDDQLPDCYRMSNVLIMPNREQNNDLEGFGISFLEASATGKPVIGGRSGGTSEAVSHGISGELIDGTDLKQLVAAIRAFLVEPGKAEAMGRAGRTRAQLEFDWKIRAQQLRYITRDVAARHKL